MREITYEDSSPRPMPPDPVALTRTTFASHLSRILTGAHLAVGDQLGSRLAAPLS